MKSDAKFSLAELESRVWPMRPDVLGAMVRAVVDGTIEVDAADIEAARRGRPSAIKGGIARVPLKGVLAPIGGLLALLFDIPDPVTRFRQQLATAAASDEVGAIIIDIDSPGGSVDNIPETAAFIREVRESSGKPIVAISNTQAASAAYWLGSQADEFVVTPSGTAGSIGVYATHQDMTEAALQAGVKITLVKAGDYKAETHPFVELTEEARGHIQEDVNTYYGMFLSDVATGRGKALGKNLKASDIAEGFGQGRSLTAKAAVQAGLADRVESLGGTIARLASRQRGALSAAEVTGAALIAGELLDGEPEEDRAEAPAGAEDHELTAEERELLAEVLA